MLPFGLCSTDCEPMLTSHQRHSKQQRLVGKLAEPPLVRELRIPQSKVEKTAGLTIDERLRSELLGEPLELAGGSGSFHQIDEMRSHASLGEEAQGLPRVGAFLDSEDLNFHPDQTGFGTRRPTARQYHPPEQGPSTSPNLSGKS